MKLKSYQGTNILRKQNPKKKRRQESLYDIQYYFLFKSCTDSNKKTGRKDGSFMETTSERLRVEQNLCQYFRLECVNIGVLNSPRGGDTDTH